MAHPNDFLIWFSGKFPEYTAPNGNPLAEGWYFWYPSTEETVGPFATSALAAASYVDRLFAAETAAETEIEVEAFESAIAAEF